ncbi:ribosome-inactivating family protein [Streptomyces coeruleorubidus]|uniref:ribosome-inactivating family protein n=1 Tax=Streptomyces coeruleorubidus TaxID=116188 RepID=UPI0037024119
MSPDVAKRPRPPKPPRTSPSPDNSYASKPAFRHPPRTSAEQHYRSPAIARGFLAFMVATSEAIRSRKIAPLVTDAFQNHTSWTLGSTYLGLMRSWANISAWITNPSTAAPVSTDLGDIRSRQQAATFLLVAIFTDAAYSSLPKDELR